MVWIKTVTILEGFRVMIGFSDGKSQEVDLEPLLHGPIFEPLRRDPSLFQTVRVDDELGTIVWDNGADMDPDVLYGSHVPAWMASETSIQT